MEINNHQEDEIDLRDLINHLIKSKIIIIITTFIFVLMTVSFDYLTPKTKPVYQSTVKLVKGSLVNKVDFFGGLNFYFPEMTSIRRIGDSFVVIKLNGPSIEKNTIKLKEVVDYAISDSEEKIERRKQEIKLEIANIDMEIAKINNSLDLLPSKTNLNNVEALLFLTRLKYQIGQLESRAFSAKNNLEDHLYLSTNSHGEIKSIQINNTKDKSKINILFSAIAGLLLSIFALTFRYVFLKK
jgi:hypothetical protein